MNERLNPTPERPTAEQLDRRVEAADYSDHGLAKDIAHELPSGWSSNLSYFNMGESVDVDELIGEIHSLAESPYVTEQAKAWATWLGHYIVENTNEAGEITRGGDE